MRRSIAWSIAPAVLFAASAAADVPVLNRCSPLALAPGKATDVSLIVTGLAEPATLWTGFPLAVPAAAPDPKAKPDKSKVAFRLHPADEVRPGIYGLRIVTPGGTSNLKLIMVDDLATVAEQSTNKSADKAQRVSAPIAVDAAYEAETFDYYTFHAEAGQRLSIEVVARRLGSPLDAVLRLLDSSGRELAYSDDDEAVGADPRLTHRFEKAGDYVVEVRDIRYQGGSNHVYRLRIGDFPLLAAPYPSGVAVGTTSLVEPTGIDLEAMKPIQVDVPKNYPASVISIAVEQTKGQGSGFTSAMVSDGPEQLEIEPNDAPAAATNIVVAGAVNGRFSNPGDVDYFRFDGKKGSRVRFVGRTRVIGSPSDLFLQLFDADAAKQLAETDDSGLEEGTLEATLPADGSYLLVVEDLVGRGGSAFTYRLEASVDMPRLTAALEFDKYDIPQAGIAQAKVSVTRGGFDGPVTLRIEGAPGVSAVGNIAASKPDGIITLAAAPSVQLGTPLMVRIVAESAADKTPLACQVSTVAALRKSLGGLPNPPGSLDGIVALSITPPAKPLFTLSSKNREVAFASGKTKAEFVVALEREKGFAEPVNLEVYGLPEGFKAAVASVAKDKSEATIVVEGPADAKPAKHPIFVVGTATVRRAMVQGSLADLTLTVGAEASDAKASDAEPAAAKTVDKPDAKAPTKPAAPKPAAKEKEADKK